MQPCKAVSDLATLLTGDLTVYLCLEGKGAVFSVKSGEVLVFGEALGSRWRALTPEGKAEQVVQWIEEAAAQVRRNSRVRWANPA